MGAQMILSVACGIALLLMCAAFFLAAWRVIKGPTLPDRIVALDTLTAIAIGFIAVIAIRTGFNLYIDIAIALGLVGFLATVAFARFVLSQGMQPGEAAAPEETAADARARRGGGHARRLR
ncbi:cation:proton antiporter [Shinella curvata]|uniref:Cation:proton antiporter n=1 Tax=Shinella curvata TaxID=1817964 RepID=A0ABT8XG26_9HYPH|nr:cation:proton antiporter [Shinella curvata]MCJ8053325.1 cation:proton antiporter [Shinella curvata]MDO6122656.1 cation:proton antiporter [Shinella curvata]